MGVVGDILRQIGREELLRVRSAIPSRTLRRALRLIVEENQGRARLFIPHYWAVYLHDGRGPVQARGGGKLVFFDDPDDDPRLRGGYPERASDIRRLSRREYERGLEINRERRARGQRPFMYVVDSVGPAAGRPWFDRLAQGSARRNGPTITRIFDAHIQELVDTAPELRPERRDARVDL